MTVSASFSTSLLSLPATNFIPSLSIWQLYIIGRSLAADVCDCAFVIQHNITCSSSHPVGGGETRLSMIGKSQVEQRQFPHPPHAQPGEIGFSQFRSRTDSSRGSFDRTLFSMPYFRNRPHACARVWPLSGSTSE
mmetsp:Transcript_20946/g.54100  ORF Transcript_20946/g.54100 Transcript_20946/m.54100 type:complete len:135 (-) Transcript_20946:481-885(-)